MTASRSALILGGNCLYCQSSLTGYIEVISVKKIAMRQCRFADRTFRQTRGRTEHSNERGVHVEEVSPQDHLGRRARLRP